MSTCMHPHLVNRLDPRHALAGRVVYIPTMAEGSVEAFAATFRWLGLDARPTPPSSERSLEVGAKVTNGDECYPARVTMGDFLEVAQQPDFDPRHSAFLMATADGPCRFGQYAPLLRKTLRDLGYGEVLVFAPETQAGYSDVGKLGKGFVRLAWRALVCADLLRRVLLQTRPYETVPGSADRAFRISVNDLEKTVANCCDDTDCQLNRLLACLQRARRRFHELPVRYESQRLLIGVVGEIFCRLNTFCNQDVVRRLEAQGAECWMSDIAEWIAYTNAEELRLLKLNGRGLSLDTLRSYVRSNVQQRDERALTAIFHQEFVGYEEPRDVGEVIALARPYLPSCGVEGEMVVSVGKAAYLARHGADGVVDISPFTCMNGIVSEAIYPRLSRDHGGIPIRSFYFDGTQSDLDRDVGIYLELAKAYRENKRYARGVPNRFARAA
jgi:predicted nucleotide-binding protein (sugar kinase/HSP70/actin superfamily)